MELDISKENIQSLASGQNAPLEVDLQASTNEDFQLQKKNFEAAISNYTGDDPLENWYNFISLVAQSHPTHTYEGNLLPLLENCLTKFKNDERYVNDFRFCKLWIKYNDLQPKPLELFRMMRAENLCQGCTDFYKAWAHYHEAEGDYKSADFVFQRGKVAVAQPYEDLVAAHANMVHAAAQSVIAEVNQQRLIDQRQALTTLQTYDPDKVRSIRPIKNTDTGIVHSSASTSKSNIHIPKSLDRNESLVTEAVSVISVANSLVAFKDGQTQAASTDGAVVHQEPTFKVHGDERDGASVCLSSEFYSKTSEGFSMYPKSKVNNGGNQERSIEEMKSNEYAHKKNQNQLHVSQVETVQAIPSVLADGSQQVLGVSHEQLQGTECLSSIKHNASDIQITSTLQNHNQVTNQQTAYQTSLQHLVSTPQPKYEEHASIHLDGNLHNSIELPQKPLFEDYPDSKQKFTLCEGTKNYGSSSSNSSSLKQSNNVSTISHSKALSPREAAILRTSMVEQMECESVQSSPVKKGIKPVLTQAPSDPFKSSLLTSLLNKIGFSGKHYDNYILIPNVPRLVVRKEITNIGNNAYYVNKILGKGTYGQVYKATDVCSNRVVALKSQKKPNYWEFYICQELQNRLANHPLKDHFMAIEIGYFNAHLSIFVSEFSKYGSLLDAVNTYKQSGQNLNKKLCVYFCIQMLDIIVALHNVKIIHADIKPDNFLVFVVGNTLQLQLIDFGCSIDMTLFPPGSTFNRCITTKNFICCEMQDGRPWNYHTDLFCIAATAHVLLFDKYMQLQKKGDIWSITQYISRCHRPSIWNTFFNTLLNQPPEGADAEKLSAFLTENLRSLGDISMDLRHLVNVIKKQ